MSFGLLAALSLWGTALALLVTGLFSYLESPTATNANAVLPLLLTSSGSAAAGLLLIISAGYALLRIVGRPNGFKLQFGRPWWLILTLLPVLGLGFLLSKNAHLALFLLPPVHIVAIGISVLWVLAFSLRGLMGGSPQRNWAVFSTGLVLAPFFSLIFEGLALLILGGVVMAVWLQDPNLEVELTHLILFISQNPNMDPAEVLSQLEPLLARPATIYLGLLVAAVIVPLIEELFKPVGVWLLINRNPTPTEGFMAGALSGAGFALFESYTLSANSGTEWVFVVAARIGTTLIHVLTTALMGWAFALAWREKQYIRLGLTYFLSVSIHALWNGLVVLSIAPEILPQDANYPQSLLNIGQAAPVGFGFLLLAAFVLLFGSNLALKRAAPDRIGYNSPAQPGQGLLDPAAPIVVAPTENLIIKEDE